MMDGMDAALSDRLERALRMTAQLSATDPLGLGPGDEKRPVLSAVREAAEGLGITPVLIGGIAVAANGYLRTTADVDILVRRADAERLIAALAGEFEPIHPWVLKHRASGVRLDIFPEGHPAGPGTDRMPDPARVSVRPTSLLPVVGLLDLLALKAAAASMKDQADFVELVKVNGLDASAAAQVRGRLADPASQARVDTLFRIAEEERRRGGRGGI